MRLNLALAVLLLLGGTLAPSEVHAEDLVSASFRSRGGTTNAGGAARLTSTAGSPRFLGSGTAIGQPEAVGLSGSSSSLTTLASAFWPIAAGDLPTLDFDGDGLQAFFDADDDDDGLLDVVETDTGIFVDANDTGSSPLDADSDDDGFEDGEELLAGSDPNNPASVPGVPVPGLSLGGLGLLALAMSLVAARVRARPRG